MARRQMEDHMTDKDQELQQQYQTFWPDLVRAWPGLSKGRSLMDPHLISIGDHNYTPGSRCDADRTRCAVNDSSASDSPLYR
jgi:hypothetical protein